MILSTDAPDQLLYLDSIDMSALTSWELPAYLRACARLEAWAAARKTAAVGVWHSRRPERVVG